MVLYATLLRESKILTHAKVQIHGKSQYLEKHAFSLGSLEMILSIWKLQHMHIGLQDGKPSPDKKKKQI